MDTDRVTTSTLRKRRLTALLLSTLVATSLLIATPSTQKPAYGLVEAGFVDAVGRYGRISVDGSGGASCIWRQVCCCLGQYSSPSLWDMGRIILLCVPYTTAIEAFDIDTWQQLWVSRSGCDAINVQVGRDGTVYSLGTFVNAYDPENGEALKVSQFVQVPSGSVPIVENTHSDISYYVQRDFNTPYNGGPTSRAALAISKVFLPRIRVELSGTVDMVWPCGGIVNPATGRVYLVDEMPGRVVVVDSSTLRELGSIPIAPFIGARLGHGGPTCPVAINPARGKLYLLRWDTPAIGTIEDPCPEGQVYLVAVDLESNTVAEEKETATRNCVSFIAADPRTSKVYVYAPTDENPNRVQVFSDSSPETLIGDLQTGRYTQWFFGEGTTRPGYRMWLTLFSPDQPNKVRISYLTGPGQPGPFFQEVELPANTRITINVNDQIGEGLDVSTRIVSVWGKPFYAERPMYFRGGEATSDGGSLGAGQHN